MNEFRATVPPEVRRAMFALARLQAETGPVLFVAKGRICAPDRLASEVAVEEPFIVGAMGCGVPLNLMHDTWGN